ncbi:uncharacterized protein TRIREDRAFT_103671 [Trichoderma reesei QM6a]|uniref:Predicted protein n=2 Tax=Hypocrea jecorina TaxID=51453 RepID=G0RB20_HYPJQ|nr:uncharacterized protein TRIREDRAFT_103671 [Trichoderma reesei QM6a]EGR51958.1 predicted protein [Trichoderma reesei QM6a]ETS05451.1 hypothetical protein M419DRAFT_32777 [Trichoderma reesei RUT C-30]
MAPKNNNRGENPPAYGEPPQVPEAAYGGYAGYQQQGQPSNYQQGFQSPQGQQQAYYQPGPQMGYYNQQQGYYQGQYPGGYNQWPQGQYAQGQYAQGQYGQYPPQGYYGDRRPGGTTSGLLGGLALGIGMPITRVILSESDIERSIRYGT